MLELVVECDENYSSYIVSYDQKLGTNNQLQACKVIHKKISG